MCTCFGKSYVSITFIAVVDLGLFVAVLSIIQVDVILITEKIEYF